ncbi:9748_t:CDS:2, partial [Paraglomus occultum]
MARSYAVSVLTFATIVVGRKSAMCDHTTRTQRIILVVPEHSACCEASAPQCKNKSGRKNQERISNEANDKPKTSVENTNTSIEGNEKGTPQSIIENNKHAQENDKNYLENDDKNDNWSKPVKLIINENNSPQPVKSSSEGNQRSSEFLVINLKDIKKITLTSDGDLIIEFNQPENNSDKSLSRTITTEQINTNQELQTVKNYCQRNGKNSLSQQELNNLINSNKTSASTNKSKDDNNSALAIGLSVAVALIVG